jgi:hypothetical protein
LARTVADGKVVWALPQGLIFKKKCRLFRALEMRGA